MGYAIYQMNGRDCGYGVPAVCEQPDCNEEIDRGMAYCCGGAPDSEHGCNMYFCAAHLYFGAPFEDGSTHQVCEICFLNRKLDAIDPDGGWKLHAATYPEKPDVEEWCHWKLDHESWEQWRSENPKEVTKLKAVVKAAGEHSHDWGDDESS